MRHHTPLPPAPLLPALLLAALAFPRLASACAVAPPHNHPVAIADESAIIIWDAATRTQHFIRRASFNTEAPDFGFLVPTPARPELAEADDAAFAELQRITAPRVVQQKRPPAECGCAASPMGRITAGGVRVLEEKRVAGYDAAVLKSDDADALNAWLAEHGYESSPALAEWAAPYVKAGWTITAFKVAKDDSTTTTAPATQQATAATRGLATSAVRMTFKTDRPFFPYREPADQSGGAATQTLNPGRRMLRVYFLADRRFRGTAGDAEESARSGATTNWAGRVEWSNKVGEADRQKVVRAIGLPVETPPAAWWLTEFEDPSNPRDGTADVYFSPDPDQSPAEREPHVQYVTAGTGPLPECGACYALAAYLTVSCLANAMRRPRRKLRRP